MAETGTVISANVYLAVETNKVLTMFAGMYIVEDWDASPIIVSTDGEETPIFGLVVR